MCKYNESDINTDCFRSGPCKSEYDLLADDGVAFLKTISIEECNKLCEEAMKYLVKELKNGLKIDAVLRNSLQKVRKNDRPIFMASVCLSLAIKSMYKGFVITPRSNATIIKVVHADNLMEILVTLDRVEKKSRNRIVSVMRENNILIYEITNVLPKIYV